MALKKGWQWPWIVAGALACGVIGNLAMMVVASRNASFAVEPDYYQKALHWDEKRLQDRTNENLGWDVALAFAKPDPLRPELELSVVLTDGSGAPLEGATLAVTAFPIARASELLEARLEGGEAGRYTVLLPIRRAGLWEYRFVVDHDGQRFTATRVEEMLGR